VRDLVPGADPPAQIHVSQYGKTAKEALIKPVLYGKPSLRA